MPDAHSTIQDRRDHRRGAMWILISCVMFATMWGFIREASARLHASELVLFRNLWGLLFMLPIMWQAGPDVLRTSRFALHVRRALSGIIATFATFYAIANAPMATTISINYTTPLFATIFAILMLKERVRMRRVAALLCGFIGVLIVLRPGQLPMTPGILAGFVSAITTALSIIAVKQLTASEDSRAIVFYSFLLPVPVCALMAVPVWQWPQGMDWLTCMAIGAFATGGQLSLVRAYHYADTSSLMPYDFVRFTLVVLIGIIWFGERADGYTLLGGTIILSSTLYLAHRERRALASSRPASATTRL